MEPSIQFTAGGKVPINWTLRGRNVESRDTRDVEPKSEIKQISRMAREEPVSGGEVETYSVVGGPARNVGTKEGRRALAGDLGLPNVKRKFRSKFGPKRRGAV